MKRIQTMGTLILSVILFTATFAFTHAKGKTSPQSTKVFIYVGGSNTVADITNPAKWTDVTSNPPHCDGFPLRVCSMAVTNSGLIYTSGINTGKPKVDVSGSALYNDVLTAFGWMGGGIQAVNNGGVCIISVTAS